MRRVLLLTAVLTAVAWRSAIAGPGSASGPITVDSTTFVAGSSVMGTEGGVYSDTLPPIASTTTAAFRMTPYRAEHVNLRDNSGNQVGTIGNPLYTTASTTITLTNVTVTNSSFSVTGSTVTTAQPNAALLNATVVQATPANLRVSASIDGGSNTVKAQQSGTWNVNNTSVNVATVTVSGTPNVAVTNTPTVTVGSALPTGTNNIGKVTGSTITVVNPAGSNLGVNVNNTVAATLSAALPSGTNQIGTVSGSSVTINTPGGAALPVSIGTALPAGTNSIGSVTAAQLTPGNLKMTAYIASASNTVTAVQPTGSNLHVDVDNYPTTQSVSGSSVTAFQGGTWSLSPAVGTSSVTFAGVAQPVTVSGTPNVAVTNVPTVKISSSGVNGSTITAVIYGTPAVTVSGTVNTTIGNTPAVTISGVANTLVTNLPAVSTVTFNGIAQPVSGTLSVTGSTVNVNIDGTVPVTQSGSWTNTVTQATPANLQVSASINGSSNTVAAAQSGSWTNTVTQGTNSSLRASVDIDGSSNTVVIGGGTANVGKILFQNPTTATLSSAVINTSSTGDSVIVSTVSSQTVRVYRMFFVVSAATTLSFKSGGATSLTGVMTFTAGGSFAIDFSGEPWFITTSGQAFIINQTGTAQISGVCYYTQS